MLGDFIYTFSKIIKEFKNKLINFIHINQNKIINLEKTNFNLGLYHFRTHNLNDAILRFKIVLLLNKNNSDAYYHLARCQFLKDQKEKAHEFLNKCLKISPAHKEAKFFLKFLDKNSIIDEIPISIIKEYFDKYATEHGEELDIKQGYFLPTDLAETTYKHKKNASYILDLGCGMGITGFEFKKKYPDAELIGVDISQQMLKQLQLKQQNQDSKYYKSLINTEIEQYLLKTKKKFDIVIGCLSLHYNSSIFKNLTQIKSILAAEGVISLAVEKNSISKEEVALNYEHENFFYSKIYLEKEIKKSGLIILDIIETSIRNDKTALICVCKK